MKTTPEQRASLVRALGAKTIKDCISRNKLCLLLAPLLCADIDELIAERDDSRKIQAAEKQILIAEIDKNARLTAERDVLRAKLAKIEEQAPPTAPEWQAVCNERDALVTALAEAQKLSASFISKDLDSSEVARAKVEMLTR